MSIDLVQNQVKKILKNLKDNTINFDGTYRINLKNIKNELKKYNKEYKNIIFESHINVMLVHISRYKKNTNKVLKSITESLEYIDINFPYKK